MFFMFSNLAFLIPMDSFFQSVRDSISPSPQALWEAWDQIWHLLVAFFLALPIGWDRERRQQSAGVRTFPLVAVAACVIMMIGGSIADGNPEAQSRALYGIVTGMGFLGAGAILKSGQHVYGLTTAASLWSTAALGAAVAVHEFVIATALAITNFLLLRVKHNEIAPHPEPDDMVDRQGGSSKKGPARSQHEMPG